MKQRIVVTIGGIEYPFVSTEGEEHVRRAAGLVDSRVNEYLSVSSISQLHATVLAAVNIADEYYKMQDTAENLRRQIKDYIEDSSRQKAELMEARRELAKYKNA